MTWEKLNWPTVNISVVWQTFVSLTLPQRLKLWGRFVENTRHQSRSLRIEAQGRFETQARYTYSYKLLTHYVLNKTLWIF
jgi:hypothetical protein